MLELILAASLVGLEFSYDSVSGLQKVGTMGTIGDGQTKIWRTIFVRNHVYFGWQRSLMTETSYLWQKQSFCHSHWVHVEIVCVQTQIVCDRHWLSVTFWIKKISVICRELTKILIHALSWTISNKKIPVMDKKYFLEACLLIPILWVSIPINRYRYLYRLNKSVKPIIGLFLIATSNISF